MIYSRTIWRSRLRGGTRFYSEDQTEQKYAILANLQYSRLLESRIREYYLY